MGVYIAPVVIDDLGRGSTRARTHTQASTHTDNPHGMNFKKPGARGRHAPGLKTTKKNDNTKQGLNPHGYSNWKSVALPLGFVYC